MSDWISVEDRLPSNPQDQCMYESQPYIVTDGVEAGITNFDKGCGGGAWAYWNAYGDIPPERITHWMPLPEPPSKGGE